MSARRAALALLGLAALVSAGCGQGFVIGEVEPGSRTATHIKFLFSEGQTEFQVTPPLTVTAVSFGPTITPAPPAASSPNSRLPAPALTPARVTATPTAGGAAPTAAPGRTSRAATATVGAAGSPAATTTPSAATAAIKADLRAQRIVVDPKVIDPDMTTALESTDPTELFTDEVIVQGEIESFALVGARRTPAGFTPADLARPVEVVEHVFVHTTARSAKTFWGFLGNQVAGELVDGVLQRFTQVYPNLKRSARQVEPFDIAQGSVLIEIHVNPNMPAAQRPLGPSDPYIYVMVLGHGRVTALLQLSFFAQPDPDGLRTLGETLIARIPLELAPSAP